jgi:lipoprotein NlpD
VVIVLTEFRMVVAGLVGLLIAGCASTTPAPIDIRRPGVPSPALPAPVVTKPVAPVAPVAVTQVPAEPQVEVKAIAPQPSIEARPIEVRPIITSVPAPAPEPVPPVAAPIPVPPVASPPQKPSPPTPASLRAELKTEPRAYKTPYSDENLAALQRGEEPRRDAPKPEARVPEVRPPVAVVKPDAPPVAATPPDPDAVDWMWPAAGRVLDNFETNTKGVSISGRLGESVLAAGPGRVVYSGSGLRGYGQLVIIKHNETFLSAYAHNSRILVKEGDAVRRGQKIAEIGATDTDRPKLHFEIRRSGKPVDPIAFLPERR